MAEFDTHGSFAHAEVPDRLIAIGVTRIGARAETSLAIVPVELQASG